MRRQLLLVIAACLGLLNSGTISRSQAQDASAKKESAEATPKPAQDPTREAVGAVLRRYVEAFNKGEAKAVASLWTPGGVYIDSETGDRVEGRAALEADFAAFFKQNRNAHLSGQVTSVRSVTPDVASVEGTASVVLPDSDPSETTYTAVFVKNGEEWLIDSVHETDVPTPPSSTDALKDLEFLIGKWVDESDDVRVETTIRWSPSKAFLLRSFSAQGADGEENQGTQVIGWDPRSKQIRSWTFNSDGSFGDGVWAKTGDEWHVKSTQTGADGEGSSGTYVVARVDDNTLTVQLIGLEVEGEPRPSTEAVRVVRVQSQAAAQQSDSTPGGDR